MKWKERIIRVWCECGIVLGKLVVFEDMRIIVMFLGLIFGRVVLIFWEYKFWILYSDGKDLWGKNKIICCNLGIFEEFILLMMFLIVWWFCLLVFGLVMSNFILLMLLNNWI